MVDSLREHPVFVATVGYAAGVVLQNANTIMSTVAFAITAMLAGVRLYKELKSKPVKGDE